MMTFYFALIAAVALSRTCVRAFTTLQAVCIDEFLKPSATFVNRHSKHPFLLVIVVCSCLLMITGCDSNNANAKNKARVSDTKDPGSYREGSDYVLFERVRLLDKRGFDQPREAYSILLPKGWRQQSEIIWNAPGSSCAGTYRWLKATSADGKCSFEMLPDILYNWNTNQQMMEFNRNNSSSSPNCGLREPVNAEEYLRKIFGPEELGNPEITKVEPNQLVVDEMRQSNERAKSELMQYGSAQIEFYQTAINASLRWKDGRAGFVVLGVTVIENTVPNIYNGTSDKIFTTQVTKRTVYKYPASENEQATNQFSIIMGSFRTNPAWNESVQNFWKDVRQRKQIAHIGKIKMMDEQTRAIGEAAIRNGQARLNAMDGEMRSWEQRQDASDRMHTNFIKTIREVENYQDETGKIELTSGYNHAWSRSDGSSFIMSDNPNFDPGSVFQDQRWKEMKKVD